MLLRLRLWSCRWPSPLVMAGVRRYAVLVVATATLAAVTARVGRGASSPTAEANRTTARSWPARCSSASSPCVRFKAFRVLGSGGPRTLESVRAADLDVGLVLSGHLTRVAGALTTEDLVQLDRRAAVDRADPEAPARDWLTRHGFIKK